MKKFMFAAAALAVALTTSFAADKEVTVSGKGQCAKCSLKEGNSCQNVVVEEKDGKKTTYYLAKNDVSTKFHSNICSETKDVTATGSVKEEGGKKVMTVSKIEVAKK